MSLAHSIKNQVDKVLHHTGPVAEGITKAKNDLAKGFCPDNLRGCADWYTVSMGGIVEQHYKVLLKQVKLL